MAKGKVLIVDDEAAFSTMLKDYLKTQGYEVSMATNHEDAINSFRRNQPKVVILDFNMPIVTGEKFLPILQTVNPLIRVIVITGCLEEEVEDRFKGLGYFAFFEKANLSLEKVRDKVEEALAY